MSSSTLNFLLVTALTLRDDGKYGREGFIDIWRFRG